MSIETNWYVLTGGPSSGQSATAAHLAFLDLKVIPEAARIFIEDELSRGRSLKEIRADEVSFQREVFYMKLGVEQRTRPDELTFFERGLPCSIPYTKLADGDISEIVHQFGERRYKQIFIFEQLPFKKDHARTEDAILAQKINQGLHDVYSDLGYNPVRVPVMPISDRVEFILSRVRLS